MDSSKTADQITSPSASTRVVGIGASAGGLNALEYFFQAVPPDSGLAYVVVQHLDPTQKALLAELLQRVTSMPVREAVTMMHIVPNCVYVIPPNTEITVSDGVLKLAVPSEPRGMRLPINILFSSLARAQGERSIAVVLSGMGSDGTLGMHSVKAMGVSRQLSNLIQRNSTRCPGTLSKQAASILLRLPPNCLHVSRVASAPFRARNVRFSGRHWGIRAIEFALIA
jgi:chemotaxis response regulator CheB